MSTNSLKTRHYGSQTFASTFSLERTTCRPNADAPSATVAKDSFCLPIAAKQIAIATEANAPPAMIPTATAPVPGLTRHQTESVVGNGNNGSKAKHSLTSRQPMMGRATKNKLLLTHEHAGGTPLSNHSCSGHRGISDSPEHDFTAE
ncbi:unnamed protein product [Ceratitis capitata]|uniref:(Mediterranean fruit fly) hypothetical protein n=1 Tax=Ceratitis capitata TaxID=7213 RepID=A0A811U2T0_CERCA|nr:unnamed protein product [Ceratitis capitata]